MTYKLSALFWLLQGAQRREFRYIYKPGNPGPDDARICFTFFNDNDEFQ